MKNIDTVKHFKDLNTASSMNNDCAVRAMAIALDLDYNDSVIFCKHAFSFNPRGGSNLLNIAEWFNSKDYTALSFTKKFSLGYLQKGYKVNHVNITTVRGLHVNKFRCAYNKGVYVVISAGHMFTIKDGDVYGNYNDHNKYIQIAYKII